MIPTRPALPAAATMARLEDVSEQARPVAEATAQLRTVTEELKVEKARAVGDLRRAVVQLGHDCAADRSLEVARVLYWRHPEIPISDITIAFGFSNSATLAAAVGPVLSQACCEDCGVALVATSRRQLAELDRIAVTEPAWYRARPLCPRCRDRSERAIADEPPDDIYDNDPEAYDDDDVML